MGDPAHQARTSDHNVGNAFDITHDPAHGFDCAVWADKARGDSRVKYVIWNRKIWSRAYAAKGWRNYTGTNPHSKHMHVSIYAASRDDCRPWPWAPKKADEMTEADFKRIEQIVSRIVGPKVEWHETFTTSYEAATQQQAREIEARVNGKLDSMMDEIRSYIEEARQRAENPPASAS
jgi:hypothetical protein